MSFRSRFRFLGPVCVALAAAGLLSVPAPQRTATAADDSGIKAPLPPELAVVPPDAIAFVHVRLADLWKSEAFKDFRDLIQKAGPKAIQAFDKRFVPHPSTLDRLTFFVLPPGGALRDPQPIVVLTTSAPINKEQFLQSAVPGAVEKKAKAGSYYDDAKTRTGISFLGDRAFLFGPSEVVAHLLNGERKTQGPLSLALERAHAGRPLVVGLNASMLPPEALRDVPPPLRPLFKAKLAMLSFDLADDGRIDVQLNYANADQAKEADDALKAAVQMARQALGMGRAELMKRVVGSGGDKPSPLSELPEAAASLLGLGVLEQFDAILKDLPVKRQGDSLQATVRLPKGGGPLLALSAMGAGLLLPAVQKVREAAARAQDQNNLKQIGLAMHIYHDAYNSFPPAAICDKKGKPLLSWRVAILPYIEQDNLYKQFKLDEPWDSEHNKKLLAMMPKVYANPITWHPGDTKTSYRVFVGNGAFFDLIKGPTIAQITDGTSNTIMVAETDDMVPWTKPDEVEYDPKKPLPKLSQAFPGGSNVLFADGSVRFIRSTTNEKILRALITRAGGEPVGADDF